MTTLDARLGRLYTPLHDAVSCINGRTRQRRARLPSGIPTGKYAVFGRQVATASHETIRFLQLAQTLGLTPLFFEFHGDKFVTRNRSKLALGHMRFVDSLTDGHSGKSIRIVNVQTAQGLPLASVSTVWGQSLIDFHHSLLHEAIPKAPPAVMFDGSAWFRSFGPTARDYYQQWLSLFTDHCILFENYLLQPHEVEFTQDIVLPAFEAVSSTVGRPMIVPLDPTDSTGHEFWMSYPTSIRARVLARMNRSKDQDMPNKSVEHYVSLGADAG